MSRQLIPSFAALLALAACTHAPTVQRYQPPPQAEFVNAQGASSQEPVAEFWHGFHDEELDALVQRAR